MIRFLLLTMSVLSFFTTQGHAQDRFLDIQEITTPSGITIWLAEDHSVPVIALKFSFSGGAALDPEKKSGTARLVSNTLDEGADNLDGQAFQKALNDHAITLHFSSGRDYFSGTLKTTLKYQDKAIELLNKSINAPRFDAEALERMRASNLARIRSNLSEPEWIAARFVNDRMYEGHPYARNSGGSLTSMKMINREDLQDFVKNRFGKDTLLVAASGAIGKDEITKIVDTIFGDLPAKAVPYDLVQTRVQNTDQTILYKMDIPQTHIHMIGDSISRHDPDWYAAQVMNQIFGAGGFGSRLMEEVREKRGLTYGIYSYPDIHDKAASFHITTSTKNDTAKEALDIIYRELDKMAKDGAAQSEMDDAKAYLTGSLPLSLTSTDKIASILLRLQRYKLSADTLDTRNAKIEMVTNDDIKRAAKRLLSGPWLTILVGDPQNITPTSIATEIPDAK